jgi:hypothetical protein
MNKRKQAIIIIALIILIIQTCTLSVLASKGANEKQKNGKGQGKGGTNTLETGVYNNYQCTDPLSSIDWGMIEAGASKNMTCFIKNEGTTAMLLSLKTSNWNPKTAFKEITITWDYDGQPLNPSEVIQVLLTLSVLHTTDLTNFGVDITVVGSF